MAFTPFPKTSLLGFQAQGDVAGFTLYTDKKNQIVAFLAAQPKEPASWRQTHFRNRWRQIATIWQQLTTQERATWQTLAQKNRLSIDGYAVYTWWKTKQNRATLATLKRKAAIPTLPGE